MDSPDDDYGTPCRDCGGFEHAPDCEDRRDRREAREDKVREYFRGAR